MNGLKYLLSVFLLFYFAAWANAEKIMRPKLKDIKVWSDNVYVTHTVTFDDADPHLNLSANALQELHDVDLHVEGNMIQKKDPNYFLSFNTTMNLCRLINWRNQSPIGSIIHAYMKEYGNLIENCPIVKGEYYMRRFWVPEDTTTSTLPEMDFDLHFMAHHIDGTNKRTMIIDDHFAGELVVQDVNNVKRGILGMFSKSG